MSLHHVPTPSLIAELNTRLAEISDVLRRAGVWTQRYSPILEAVTAAWELRGDELFAETRRQPIPQARWAAMELLAEEGYGSTTIGEIFGMDHSSVLHGRKALARLRTANPWVEARFQEARRRLEEMRERNVDAVPSHQKEPARREMRNSGGAS